MASECLERRLTAILAADVAGYGRLIGEEEEGTHAQLKEHLRVIVYPEINRHRGRIVKNTGDGMLAEFGRIAEDGIGEHSPFTASLVKRLREPNIEINKLFRLVTSDVLQSTSNRQQPFLYGSIPSEDEFFFKVSTPLVGLAR